jgi:uncharacterized protein YndB with AHSA1/START domain
VIDPSSFAVTGRPTRRVTFEAVVAASPQEAFDAWVDPSRVVEFMGHSASVDLRIGGRYEILFRENVPVGQQGSEQCRILAYLPGDLLAFSWNAPPEFGEIRSRHTWVVVTFSGPSSGPTRVRLAHTGFGEGLCWDECVAYFEKAWRVVLDGLSEYLGTA